MVQAARKPADRHVLPAVGVEEHRQADHEPDVARAEHEDAGGRQQVDGAGLGEQLRESSSTTSPCPASAAARSRTPARTQAEQSGHQPERRTEPDELQQGAADEEANALHGVLRAGEPGDPAEQLPSALLRRRLDRGFRGGLGQVLGDTGDALRGHHPGDRAVAPQAGSSADSISRPPICSASPMREHARNAEARRQPAAAEIGEDARRLVEQEQERQRERRVAELVEMQQHQHPKGAVGEGEAPVGSP